MNFLETPRSIAANLTISGINETTFETDLRSDLEKIIADITKSSESSVNATFLKISGKHALINVSVTPSDSRHEQIVISMMHDTASFLKELNNRLGGTKMVVITVGKITPYPGTLIYIIRLHKFYNMKKKYAYAYNQYLIAFYTNKDMKLFMVSGQLGWILEDVVLHVEMAD